MVAILLAVLIPICVLFVPKFYRLWFPADENTKPSSIMASSVTGKHTPSTGSGVAELNLKTRPGKTSDVTPNVD